MADFSGCERERETADSLLERMAQAVHASYLSDLRCELTADRQVSLARFVERIPARSASLREWNDALAYIAGGLPQASRELAREALLDYLGKR